ncbi:MAG: cation transporter [Armatimonadetes bacterium]|nr:cation transporter [Armatimonadota bacterium]
MTTRKSSAARLSVFSNSALVLMKVAVGLASGSVSILAEALHSGLDLLAAVIAWVSVRAADRPPDDEHPYGHGKLENLSGTIEAALILATALWIGAEGIERLLHPRPVQVSALALLVLAVSAAANLLVSRHLFRVARAEQSVALEADAHHLSVDVYTSVGVLAGLALIRATGWHWLDGLIAVGLAVAIARIAWELTHRAAHPLLDARLPEAEESALVASIRADPRVLDCHAVRSRSAGAWAYLDAHVAVAPGTTLEDADRLEEELRARLRRHHPRLDVLLHVEPAASGEQG